MKYIIIGCRYNGTTSLEKFLKNRGWNVIRNESIFDSNGGFEEWYFKYKTYKPIIILSAKKKHLFDFKYLLQKWEAADPIIFDLESLQDNINFPKLNKGSTLKGQFRHEHHEFLDGLKAVELALYEGKLKGSIPDDVMT